MDQRIDLIATEVDGQLQLKSPEVGHFSCSLPQGSLLSPGQVAGVIRKLGQSFELCVPAGVSGRVTNARPELINAPVSYGSLLYSLAALSSADADAGAGSESSEDSSGAPSFRSPHAGRFWHRPAPNEPAFVELGKLIQSGEPIGLIEVMKTFTHLNYEATGSLPKRAKVTRILVGDGDEVSEGDVLFELESSGD